VHMCRVPRAACRVHMWRRVHMWTASFPQVLDAGRLLSCVSNQVLT